MRVSFFTAVINVQFASISGRGDEIADGLYITTDKDTISGLLIGDVKRAIGVLETDFLLNAPAVIYSRKDVTDDFEWREYLGSRLREVKMFFHVMWLLKDNAADSELGFLTYEVSGLVQNTHSNAVSVTYGMADGSKSVITFSRKELKEIRAYYRAFVGEIEAPTAYGVLRSGLGRTMRAFYWIQAGRAAKGSRRAHSVILHCNGKSFRYQFVGACPSNLQREWHYSSRISLRRDCESIEK